MIVPMKKVTLLCLEAHKAEALSRLQGLALMQLTGSALTGDSPDVDALKKRCTDLERAYMYLQTLSIPKNVKRHNIPRKQMADRILELVEKRNELLKKIDVCQKKEEILIPWGHFSLKQLEGIRQQGISVIFCETPTAVFDARKHKPAPGNHFPENAVLQEISRDKIKVCYVLLSRTPLTQEDGTFEEIALPAETLDQIREKLHGLNVAMTEVDRELALGSMRLKVFAEVCKEAAEQLEFGIARDGMEKAGEICYLSGYVPETKLEDLRAAALENGWALMIREPDADAQDVPTLIQKPKFLNILDPLFDFIGITPGYRENDVYLFFLLFFPIFFGMIVGDAGYGLIFLAICFICKWIFRRQKAARMPLNLMILLSCFTFLWGWLNGSWFGMPRSILPDWMSGLNLLADPKSSPFANDLAKRMGYLYEGMTEAQTDAVFQMMKNKFVQYLCFLLAALHLASARLFKFMDEVRHTWLALGHLGWAMLIVANFMTAVNLIVFKGTFPVWGYGLYGLGTLLVVITIRGEAALNLPFALIGSFTDVLSYIRLFAVGLSGAYIAENFNNMGFSLVKTLPNQLVILGFILMIVVIFAGHILNVALGFLSVLVHAVRLNTLEFSNHMEMQWSGQRFHPFSSCTKKGPENTEPQN